MPIFGRKKEKEEIVPPPMIEKKLPEQIKPEPTEKPKEVKEEKPRFAPLFVKLDRYKQILNVISYLKTAMLMIKNTLNVLNELDKLREENLNLIKEAIEKVDKQILTLDSEFMRPSSLREEMPEVEERMDLELTLSDLKNQIEKLKAELERIST